MTTGLRRDIASAVSAVTSIAKALHRIADALDRLAASPSSPDKENER